MTTTTTSPSSSPRDFADYFYDAQPPLENHAPWYVKNHIPDPAPITPDSILTPSSPLPARLTTHWPYVIMVIVLAVSLASLLLAALWWRRCVRLRRLLNTDMLGTAVPPGMVQLPSPDDDDNDNIGSGAGADNRLSVVSGVGARSGTTPTGEYFRPLGVGVGVGAGEGIPVQPAKIDDYYYNDDSNYDSQSQSQSSSPIKAKTTPPVQAHAHAHAQEKENSSPDEAFRAARDSWHAALVARSWDPVQGMPLSMGFDLNSDSRKMKMKMKCNDLSYPAPRYEPR